MLAIKTASILAVDQNAPFVVDLQKVLSDNDVHAEVETVPSQPFDLKGKKIKSDVIALDVPSAINLGQVDSSSLSKFVLSSTLAQQKLFIGDDKSAALLKNNLRRKAIDEDAWQQLNLYAIDLARRGFKDLELITQDWADSHIRNTEFILPQELHFDCILEQKLRYGENPHQFGALFVLPGDRRHGVTTAHQVQGKQLSYNNINDADTAYECVAEFDPKRTAGCVIVKHANPCGVAEGESLVDAYRKALACDPVSAFGGIVSVNRTLDAEAAKAITEIFTEVIIAPGATEEAAAIVGAKKNLRLLLAPGLPDPRAAGMTIKSVAGGLLVQSRDNAVVDEMQLTTVTRRAPTAQELADLRFAFRVAKHVKSNTIVYARDRATVGIGAGQMSRIDAARIAARKAEDAARQAGLAEPATQGSVVASDAFFPFDDGLVVAIEAGATAVIQPGGSVRDDEVINAADERGVAMVFTGRRHTRHFRHFRH
jgi:AICAR transformylase/IMP cyclohydrolase PurH